MSEIMLTKVAALLSPDIVRGIWETSEEFELGILQLLTEAVYGAKDAPEEFRRQSRLVIRSTLGTIHYLHGCGFMRFGATEAMQMVKACYIAVSVENGLIVKWGNPKLWLNALPRSAIEQHANYYRLTGQTFYGNYAYGLLFDADGGYNYGL